ncbi:hypothetical protein HanXRQr2_Chr12g0533631 [Helianthus annuus]|uniref:Uncharacterized protein n=1 Tax=Helianthus annuus TaxID=4232 RepID=A0A9K3HFA1_HELAN|nr:hypothetical protein HanXRQr2_Chr12g0533631 [Helianthus annuus]KAJ0862079.1 hypothetical protein HanPSC8_Chr12g0513971 [Helianthus annuus]
MDGRVTNTVGSWLIYGNIVITVDWNKSWTRHQKGLQKWLDLLIISN